MTSTSVSNLNEMSESGCFCIFNQKRGKQQVLNRMGDNRLVFFMGRDVRVRAKSRRRTHKQIEHCDGTIFPDDANVTK